MGQTFWGSGGSDKNEMINLEIDVRIPQSLRSVLSLSATCCLSAALHLFPQTSHVCQNVQCPRYNQHLFKDLVNTTVKWAFHFSLTRTCINLFITNYSEVILVPRYCLKRKCSCKICYSMCLLFKWTEFSHRLSFINKNRLFNISKFALVRLNV